MVAAAVAFGADKPDDIASYSHSFYRIYETKIKVNRSLMLGRVSVFIFFSHIEHLGTFFCGFAAKKPGFPLQLLALTRCGVSASIPCAPRGFLRFAQVAFPTVTANAVALRFSKACPEALEGLP
jgi:hypothetical protein